MPGNAIIDLKSGSGKEALYISTKKIDSTVDLIFDESGNAINANIDLQSSSSSNELPRAGEYRELIIRISEPSPMASDNPVVRFAGLFSAVLRGKTGSVIFDIDENLDGRADTSLIFEGDLDPELFYVRVIDTGVEIGYGEGAPPDFGEIVGSPNDEVIIGTPSDDVIRGFGGDNIIRGGDGNDLIFGGTGNDHCCPVN